MLRSGSGFSWVRAGVIVLCAATVLRVWLSAAAWESSASAQIPDSGMQRKLLIDELRRTNALLTEIRDAIVVKGTVSERKGE